MLKGAISSGVGSGLTAGARSFFGARGKMPSHLRGAGATSSSVGMSPFSISPPEVGEAPSGMVEVKETAPEGRRLCLPFSLVMPSSELAVAEEGE